MIWVWILSIGVISAAVVLAGRAHSRYLDRIQGRAELIILPSAMAELGAAAGFKESKVTKNQVPVAIFMGQQTLICSVSADEANSLFESPGQVPRPPAELAPKSTFPAERRNVRQSYRFKTSWKAG